MLATFEPSIASMAAEFEADAAKAGTKVTLESEFVPDAMAALLAGNRDRHDALVAEAGAALAHCNAIMLAQFSMAPAADLLRRKVPGTPVLTSPGAAVAAMRRRMGRRHKAHHCWERGSPEPLMRPRNAKKSGSGEPRSQQTQDEVVVNASIEAAATLV